MSDMDTPASARTSSQAQSEPWYERISLWWIPAGLVAAVVLYYAVGMAIVSKIDDNPDFSPPPVAAPASRAVAMAAALVQREVELNGWTPNDPFFVPSWMLDDMPNFQIGIVAAVSNFATVMKEDLGVGKVQEMDLERAAGLLRYSGHVWKFDPRTSWAPTASAEKQYKLGYRSLLNYNSRLLTGDAAFDRSAPALRAAVAHLAMDLGASSAAIDQHLAEDHWALLDPTADDVFYATKGRMYAYGLVLRELGHDFAPVLADKEAGEAWARMVETLKVGALLEPPVVLNGKPDSLFIPSHLASQGFFLLRARAQMAELVEKLGK